MSDLSVVIAHRGPSLGLWTTIASVEENLALSPLETNYVIASNGEPLDAEAKLILKFLDKSGRLLEHIHSEEPLTPPTARARGAAVADGEVILFCDNHVLLSNRFIERAMLDIEKHSMDVLHSTAQFFVGDITHYHYKLKLSFNFWGDSATIPVNNCLPYKIAAGGAGAFFIKHSVWDAIGGYGPEDIYQGYAGEELNLNLKAWRMGYESWIDPKLSHMHWAGKRTYARHYTDDYYRNLMVSAFVIGGEEWLNRVYESFASGKHLRMNPKLHMFDLLHSAYARGREYSKELDSKSVHSLDALLHMFVANQIAH